MSIFHDNSSGILGEQLRIQAKCFHPSGTFRELKKDDIEQSIADRFEEQVRRNADKVAVKSRNPERTYDALI